MRVLIATGIYPPEIGGPAEYAKNLGEGFRVKGIGFRVLTYGWLKRLPSGIRHLAFFFKALFALVGVDFVIVLDTFSVALPTILASRLLGKKVIIRTGGDFLWESYVERTGDSVPFRDFYETCLEKFNSKERFIFNSTRWLLRQASAVVFSTVWQRDIFITVYGLDGKKSYIIENFFGPKVPSHPPERKNFVCGGRPLKLKNLAMLEEAFEEARKVDPAITLDLEKLPHGAFMEKIARSYAVILPSISEVSPNFILDAISRNKPFIMTRESGYAERLKDVGLLIDPLKKKDITDKILMLANNQTYRLYQAKVEGYKFLHSWQEIAGEFLELYKKL